MKSRKNAVFGFACGLTLVIATGAAYACTTWVGQFTVKTDGSFDSDNTRGNGPYEKVTTYGMGREFNTSNAKVNGATGMLHCSMDGAIRLDVDSAAPSPSTIDLDYRAFVATPNTCLNANPRHPKSTTYNISYLNTGFGDFVGGNAFGWTGTNMSPEWDVDKSLQRWMVRDCMAIGGAASSWVDANDILTVTNGVGTLTATIDPKPAGTNGGMGIPDLPGTESAICIQQGKGTYTGAPDGGQAPMIVL